MESTVFNPVQQHLLKMFAYDDSIECLEEVKRVLTQHFSKQLDQRLNDLWESGAMNQERLDALRHVDVRKI